MHWVPNCKKKKTFITLKKERIGRFQAPQAVFLILFPFSLHPTTLTPCNSTAKWVQLNFERPGEQYDPTSTTITLITQIDIAHQEAKAIQPISNNLLSHTYKYCTTRDRKKIFKKNQGNLFLLPNIYRTWGLRL